MMRRNTLFLDFDGVLHPSFAPPDFQLNLAPLLAQCLEGYDVQVVISSSWRFNLSLSQIRHMLPAPLAERIIGATGAPFEGPYTRWNEICEYAVRYRLLDWRALDDTDWEFPENCPELILCDGRMGLTESQCTEIARWLALPD